MKRYFICSVCRDVHYGMAGPEICPTCKQKNVYKEASREEALKACG